jgi:hypothetical protein
MFLYTVFSYTESSMVIDKELRVREGVFCFKSATYVMVHVGTCNNPSRFNVILFKLLSMLVWRPFEICS